MRMNKKQAYEHLARAKQISESDLDDKFNVIRILRNHFGLYGLTGEILMIDSESCRCPDVLVKGVIPICIELDGFVHGMGDQISKRDKDVDRDKDYQSVGVKLIIINKELTDGYDKQKVIEVLIKNGLVKK
jgi:hypothetical protein